MKLIRRLTSIFLNIAILTSVMNLGGWGQTLKVEAAPSQTSWRYNYTGSYQQWTAPETGQYRITLAGASGGGALVTDPQGDRHIRDTTGTLITVNVNVRAGTTYYIYVGQRGKMIESQDSGRAFNGGAEGHNGAGGGGGATDIRTVRATGANGWSNQSDGASTAAYNNDESLKSRLFVAGGGGGKGSNWENYLDWFQHQNEFEYTYGNALGIGADGGTEYLHEGYGGAGGGGWYGGYGQKSGVYSGNAGSTLISETLTGFVGSTQTKRSDVGDGYCTIEYVGKAYVDVTVQAGLGASYSGNVSTNFKAEAFSQVSIPRPTYEIGYQFEKWEILSGDCSVNGDTLTTGFEPVSIRAINLATLTLTQEYVADTRLNLTFGQQDELNKYYKVYQSKDAQTWYPAILAEDARYHIPTMVKDFGYTGNVQAYNVPADGIYKIDVWGAAGGNCGWWALGGYTYGLVELKRGDVLYVVCGGQSGWAYNGGGLGGSGGRSGGGATHIALNNNRGVLANYYNYQNDVLIVAGGGGGSDDPGGSDTGDHPTEDGAGGHGGGFAPGTNGSRGAAGMGYYIDGSQRGWAGASFGQGGSGQGAADAGGGGGGWIGGASSRDKNGGGAGGTGHVNLNKVYNWQSLVGKNGGLGKARVQLNDSTTTSNHMNGVKIWDNAAPNTPYNLNIDGRTNPDGSQYFIISYSKPDDNGTKYWHKVESYNADTGEKLKETLPLECISISGVKGYHYYIDSNPSGTATTSHTFTSSQEIKINVNDQGRYLHIAAIDNAGNLGATVTFEIPLAVVVNYYGNDTTLNVYNDTSSTHVVGNINPQVIVKGQSLTIKNNVSNASLGDTAYSKVGYKFAGWNIQSGAKAGGSAVGENGVKYTGEFLRVGSTWDCITLRNKYGPIINLYAIWEPIRYNVVFKGNDNWNTDEVGEQYTQELRYDHPEKLTPAKFDREKGDKWDGETQNQGYDFIGWGKTPEQTTPNWNEQQTVVNLTTTPDGNVPMYALWKKDLSLIFNLSGGKYNNNSNPIRLSATVYNSTKEYTFNINGGRTPANLPKYTIQNGTILAYGNVISNGKNSILTKSTSNNQLYRFLGWSTSNGAKLPNDNMIVYDNGHTTTYTIDSNKNLYAVWEEVLTVNISLNRTLGTLRFQDETAEEAWHRENKFNLQADTPVVTLETILIPGEQGGYKTTPMGNVTDIKVEFDDTLHKYYEQHNDGLNPVNDEALALNPDAIDGLDRLITTEFDHTRKFYIPEYIGDINPKKYYDVDFTITGDSFYWSYVHGTKEVIKVDGKVYIIDDEDIEIPGDGTVDGVITEFRTRIKQG